MATPANANSYFDVNTNYLSSYQINMYKEAVQMFGIDCKYIPIIFVSDDIDYVFGEIPKIHYDEAYDLRMYIDGYDELHQAVDNFSKFGLFIEPENLEITVGKEDFRNIILNGPMGGGFSEGFATSFAQVGDLIYFQIHNEHLMFEITHAEIYYNSFYHFNVKMFQYDANTAISTSDSFIDAVTSIDSPSTNENTVIDIANSENKDPSEHHTIFGDY